MEHFASGDLAFRAVGDDDVARLARWLQDPEVGAWWHGVTETYDEAFVLEHVLDDSEPWTTFSIVELRGEPIGFQQWYPIDPEPETLAEYGLEAPSGAFGIDQFIGESPLHGQGIGAQQVRAVCAWLLGPTGPGARRVLTDPVVENLRAVRCYERAGFRKVRVLPGHEELDGLPRDSWLMEYSAPG